MIPLWKLRQYVSATGREAISDWRKSMPKGPFKAVMDTFLGNMVKLERWTPPRFEPMTGNLSGFHELRWKAGKIQHRLLGRVIGEREFLMLVGCTHKGDVYTPPSALETLIDRDKRIKTREATTSEYRVLTS